MKYVIQTLSLVLLLTFTSETVLAAAFKGECLNAKSKMTDCKLDINDEILTITYDSKKNVELNKTIAGKSITRLSGGEYARRRVGESIGSAVLLGPLFLFVLFSKKKRDTFGIEYKKDDGKTDVALVQTKKKYGMLLAASLKAVSGKDIEYGATEKNSK